jgi:uncharacterized protein YcfJ
MLHRTLGAALVVASHNLAAQAPRTPTKVCLAPATIEKTVGSSESMATAVRETFTNYLTGPAVVITALTARLASQSRDEARAAGCTFLVLPRVTYVHPSSGGTVLGHAIAGAAVSGAYSAAGAVSGSTAGRIAASAATSATSTAVANWAVNVHSKDELTLGYHLESASGSTLLDKSDKRRAGNDGEDLLTPLVQSAAEAIVTTVTAKKS